MFGGALAHSAVITNKEYVIPFGPALHSYNLRGELVAARTLHKQPILAVHKHPDHNHLLSVDSAGVYIHSHLDTIIATHNLNLPLTQACFHEDNIIFTSENKLYYHNTKLKKPYNKLKYESPDKITFIHNTPEYLLLGELNQLHILSIDEGKLLKIIPHTSLITCADVFGKDVVLGDEKGKIYHHVNGINEEESQTTEKHWHTGRVNAVLLREGNLISAGEEGVVVFWHLVTEKKDFLPRFGSEIRQLILDEQKHRLCCFLSDNSLKVVLLDADKTVLHFKTIINPNGVRTKRTLIEDYKFLAGSHYLKQSGFLCLNSTPGKIQFVSPFKTHFQLDISNRNTVSRLDDDYPNPIEVRCLSFSKDENTLAIYANNRSVSYLKIFHKEQSYELVARINNPHIGEMIQMVNYECSRDISTKFVSIGTDKLLKVWKQKLTQKKSLRQEKEIVWSCETKFSHKNREFVGLQAVSLPLGNGIGITLADHHFILLNIDSGEIIHEIFLEGLESSYYLGATIAYHSENLFAICDYTTKKNLFSLDTMIKRFSVSPSEKTIAVVHEFKGENVVSLIETKKKKEINIAKSYKLRGSQVIESIFWKEETPIAVTSSLYLIGFGKSDLFNKQVKEVKEIEVEEEQEEDVGGVGFLERYRNMVNKRLYSNEVQRELNELMETIRDLPQVGNRFRLMANIILQ